MMYFEFIEMSGKTEDYISYAEYTTLIEPIYMNSACNTKQEFIVQFKDAFSKMVYPAVEKAIRKLSMDDKLSLMNATQQLSGNKLKR